ncbi:hypothetical protein HL666_27645 [Bradyrhizobium sp. 83002]|uniref:hypothetical protein n=1 Tax=Bradyrhizobium aeschynomenes TaxID=2734909 RepID=UPI00155361A7|nr:hypothetical protein [Bradyrhizobium aeschynomenes]NPU14550.1 hypothetical protein [Bradyrhizobium aeschynomenes]
MELFRGLDVGMDQTAICVVDDKGGGLLEVAAMTDPEAIKGASDVVRRHGVLGRSGGQHRRRWRACPTQGPQAAGRTCMKQSGMNQSSNPAATDGRRGRRAK